MFIVDSKNIWKHKVKFNNNQPRILTPPLKLGVLAFKCISSQYLLKKKKKDVMYSLF